MSAFVKIYVSETASLLTPAFEFAQQNESVYSAEEIHKSNIVNLKS